MDIEPTREEILKTIEKFAKTNPDDYEYIWALIHGYYGWVTLSSRKEVYISPPQSSATEVGRAFKKLFDDMQQEDNEISKLLKQIDINLVDKESHQMKNVSDILGELSNKWKELKYIFI